MKRFLTFAAVLLVGSSPIMAKSVYVKGYTTRNGTYVSPHYRSAPDKYEFNNYSAPGNTNPYTGVTAPSSPPSWRSYTPAPTYKYVPPKYTYDLDLSDPD
jgi:hypothetical protein